ncbi:CRHBP protein, partial [Eolophus roseicapillus]|nr:CRHBP protein [Eolophus roseicapilla]
MPSAFQFQCHFILIFLAASKGETRYLEARDAGEDEPFLLLSEDLKRELSAGQVYRRSLRCIDMLSIEGQFTFTADQPQLHCATFFIGEPEELIMIDYDFVNIDCKGGDFLKVRSWQVLLRVTFPTCQTCATRGRSRRTRVCMSVCLFLCVEQALPNCSVLLKVQHFAAGSSDCTSNSYTFPCAAACNVISQTPSGRFTMVIPHQHRNCSFSIIYPVVIKISDLILGHLNGLFLKVSCLFPKKLLPSAMFPLADLCHSFHGSAQMKIGCDNTVLRMVSSGKHINRVTFEYHQINLQETENRKENSIEEFCFPSI